MKRIRRVKITVREKEAVFVSKGTGQKESPENTQLTICPFCSSSLHLHTANSGQQILEKNITPLLRKKEDSEGDGK